MKAKNLLASGGDAEQSHEEPSRISGDSLKQSGAIYCQIHQKSCNITRLTREFSGSPDQIHMGCCRILRRSLEDPEDIHMESSRSPRDPNRPSLKVDGASGVDVDGVLHQPHQTHQRLEDPATFLDVLSSPQEST